MAGPVPGGVTGFPLLILRADRLRRLWRAMEVSVVALEQSGIVPAAGNGEGATSSIVSTDASRSYCLSLFSLVTELPNPKFTRYMALAKRAVGLQFSQQVHIFLK